MKSNVSRTYLVFFIFAVIWTVALAAYNYEKQKYGECIAYLGLAAFLLFLRALNIILARWRKRKKVSMKPPTASEVAFAASQVLRNNHNPDTIAERATALMTLRAIQYGDSRIEKLQSAHEVLTTVYEKGGRVDVCVLCMAEQFSVIAIRLEHEQSRTEGETA